MPTFLRRFNANHWLLLCLVVAVLLDVFAHLSHPSYRYYRRSVAALAADYADFKGRVRDEFVPSLEAVYSNVAHAVALSLSPDAAPAPDAPPDPSAPSEAAPDERPTSITADYFISDGRPYVVFDGWPYAVGDDFYGFPIVSLSPTCLRTSRRVFHLSRTPRSAAPRHPSPRVATDASPSFPSSTRAHTRSSP